MRSRAADLIAELREAAAVARPRRVRGSRRAARVDGRRPLHVPRLRRVRAGARTTTGIACAGSPDSGLGILRERPRTEADESKLSARASALAREPHPLVLTKANSRSTVHRPAYLDYVGVRRFEDGEVVGERRFLGLYTTAAYRARRERDPGGAAEGRGGRRARRLHARQPRGEGAGGDPRHLPARRAVPDPRGRAVRARHGHPGPRGAPARAPVHPSRPARSVRVVPGVPAPRPLPHAQPRAHPGDPGRGVRCRAHRLRAAAVGVRARAHPLHRAAAAGHVPDYDPAEIEARIVEATGSWTDELREALLAELGEEQGTALCHRYGDAFPAGYRDDWVARSAVVDIRRIEHLAPKASSSRSACTTRWRRRRARCAASSTAAASR